MNGYVLAAYVATIGGIGLYSARVLFRARTLEQELDRVRVESATGQSATGQSALGQSATGQAAIDQSTIEQSSGGKS